MTRGLLWAAAFAAAGILTTSAACKGHPPPQDTDKELFRTAEQLTGARELNLAKRVADFFRANRRLPGALGDLSPSTAGGEPVDDPMNDGWGKPILLSVVGSGFELRSVGQDGIQGTADDIRLSRQPPR